MLEKYESKRLEMYPLEHDVYWRVMRQHKLFLIGNSTPLVNRNEYFPTTQYNYYRYFLENGVEARYWVPVLVINDIQSIFDLVDPLAVLLIPNTSEVEKIIASVA